MNDDDDDDDDDDESAVVNGESSFLTFGYWVGFHFLV